MRLPGWCLSSVKVISMAELFAGVDEVGRGPLAGAVVAAAVVLDPNRPISGLNDSKKLTERRREQLDVVIREQALYWCVARAEVEEIDEIITDWDQLRTYWKHNEGFNEAIELTFSDIKAQAAGADRQLVGMRMRWDIRFAADATLMDGSPFSWAGETMGGTNHVIALLKEANDGPRFTAWIEAPNAPISYIAELYLKNVSPGFGAS